MHILSLSHNLHQHRHRVTDLLCAAATILTQVGVRFHQSSSPPRLAPYTQLLDRSAELIRRFERKGSRDERHCTFTASACKSSNAVNIVGEGYR